MRAALLRSRAGMTLVELLVALVIAGLVLTAALDFLRQQSLAVSQGAAAFSAVQNYRYTLATIRRDLRTAGTGITAGQPSLVYAGEDVLAFNADYASDDPFDVGAVYIDTAALAGEVQALRRPQRAALPGTTFPYPDTSYSVNGANSPAETIIFFFAADTSTARTDDFVLYRQVNRGTPGVVARNLLRTPGQPFFQYLRIVDSDTAPSRVQAIAAGNLPLRHTQRIHGAPADTGQAALIDRVRAVRVNVTATNGRTDGREQRRAVTRLIRLPNVAVAPVNICGENPTRPTGVLAVYQVVGGRKQVTLSWSASTDEGGGEQDVLRYVIWRKTTPLGNWDDPYVSVPSGQQQYNFADETVEEGTSYYYAIAAQDCSPALSSLVTAPGVFVP